MERVEYSEVARRTSTRCSSSQPRTLASSPRHKMHIGIALSEIETNPKLDASYVLRGLQAGIRLYHLRHSRECAAIDGQVVRDQRHLAAYILEENPKPPTADRNGSLKGHLLGFLGGARSIRFQDFAPTSLGAQLGCPMAASLWRLGWERPFLLGGVAPRMADSGPD